MAKKTIIHLIDSLEIGGAEILLKNSVNLLPEYTHIVVTLHGPHDLKAAFNSDVRFYCLDFTGAASFFLSYLKLRRILIQERAILIHSHLFYSNIFARFAIPRAIPIVSTLHSVYGRDLFEHSRIALWIERLSLRKRHLIIAISNTVLNDYLRWVPFEGKSLVVYNFLPDSYFHQEIHRTNDTTLLRCVAVGGIKKLKNYHYLLQAFSMFQNENIFLDIYGDGPLKEDIQQIVTHNKLKNVRLCGTIDSTSSLLPQYDLFLQASKHEGYSLTLMEAMAIGLPTLVSDIPAFREVSEGNAHFFSLNNVADLITKLLELKKDLSLRYKYCDIAKKVAFKNGSEKAYLKKVREIYSTLSAQDESELTVV